jgi:hypothetical protein
VAVYSGSLMTSNGFCIHMPTMDLPQAEQMSPATAFVSKQP